MFGYRWRKWLNVIDPIEAAASPGTVEDPLFVTITGTASGELINGTPVADVLRGGGGDDHLRGVAGDDHLYGDEGDDLLEGGWGNDVLTGGDGRDRLYGEYGDDILYGSGGDELYGGDGADRLYGPGRLYGEAGDDVLEAGDGGASLDGGQGNDILIGGDVGNSLRDFGGGDDRMIGGAGSDHIDTRGGGYDWIEARGGDDQVYVDLGSATASRVRADGGDGDDSFNLYGFSGDVLRLDHDGSGHSAWNFERIFVEGEVTVIGGARDDWVRGGDVLHGGAGDDTLSYRWGETGRLDHDRPIYFNGGEGDDVLIGHRSRNEDIADYRGSPSGVTVDLNIREAQDTGGAGFDTLWSIDHLIGSDFDDHLTGAYVVPSWHLGTRLDGGMGNDVLTGSQAEDTLIGGIGDDTLIGLDGEDTAVFVYARSDYSITINDGVIVVKGPDGTDRLTGVERLQFSDQVWEVGMIVCHPPAAAVHASNEPVAFRNSVAEETSDWFW